MTVHTNKHCCICQEVNFLFTSNDRQVTYKQSIGLKSTSSSSKHIEEQNKVKRIGDTCQFTAVAVLANAATLKLTGFIGHREMRTKDAAGWKEFSNCNYYLYCFNYSDKSLSMCKACCIFLIQETVEVQTLELAEVPVPGEGTLLDPLEVSLFLCIGTLHHMLLLWLVILMYLYMQNYSKEFTFVHFQDEDGLLAWWKTVEGMLRLFIYWWSCLFLMKFWHHSRMVTYAKC